MIAYNREWLDALLTKDAAREWHKKGLLSDEKWQAIQAGYPSNFYSPNVFVRIGLAIFGLILMLAVMGLAALISDPESDVAFSFFGLFWGIIWIVALDYWAIRSAQHLGSGIDDIMLYTGVMCIIMSLCNLLPYNTDTLVYCFIAWPFLLAGSIRYRDRLMAAATFICSLLIVLLIVNKIPGVALYLLPFTGMAFSAAAYFFARRGQRNYDRRHWSGLFIVVEMLALVTFYASGNYWVVQQVANDMFAIPQPPIGWFFWSFTFLFPLLSVYQGIVRKDRHLLDIGLACTGAAVFTFRYYFHVLPWAWAAAIAGVGLFLIAYFSIRFLHKNAGAYTYDAESRTSLLQQVEEQLIEQTIAAQTAPTPVKKESFGGGQFGGGGAGGEF